MKFAIRFLMLFALTASALAGRAAPIPQGKDAKPTHESEVKKLQGEWRLIAWTTRDGSKDVLAELSDDERKTIKVQIEGDRFDFRINGHLDRQVIRLDPAATPSAIDSTRKAGPAVGPADVNFLGVYKLEGDKLTIASAGHGKDRPKALDEENTDSSGSVYVFERVKPIK